MPKSTSLLIGAIISARPCLRAHFLRRHVLHDYFAMVRFHMLDSITARIADNVKPKIHLKLIMRRGNQRGRHGHDFALDEKYVAVEKATALGLSRHVGQH